MSLHDPERDFAEFRSRGDAKALARVFDATAPALLIVAGHVARDGAAAEDLLQSTFLAAIEHAASWDPGRRLVPWLVGILVNEARQRQRRERQLPRVPGAALARAEVRAEFTSGDSRQPAGSATRGADGRYEIDLSEALAWSVLRRNTSGLATRASSARHATVEAEGVAFHKLAQKASPGAPIVRDFALPAAAHAMGRVVGADGAPVAGARVAIEVDRGPDSRPAVPVDAGSDAEAAALNELRRKMLPERQVVAHATSDAAGRFTLTVPAAGTYRLAASADGIGTCRMPPVRVETAADTGRGPGPVATTGRAQCTLTTIPGVARSPSGFAPGEK